ncbi:hypothetical protein JOC54_001598 [Alkalihalobacillus xiaoxiensis]|uniref:Uncharacterized protein n=1 Tax=Shouchella xiaoxiensis TaxID=766895 RepID=A0ABS2SS69_9BACI|nr:hypothetical protein [Shouchella xiaoxiensis]MBM7838342.1 hypothetical protein [Shouchella xiaoxiensis]
MPKLTKVKVQTVLIEWNGAVCVDIYDGYLSEESKVVYWVEDNGLMLNTYLVNEMNGTYQTDSDTDIHLATISDPTKFNLNDATSWHRKLNSASLFDFIVAERGEIGGNDLRLSGFLKMDTKGSRLRGVV